MVQYGKYTTLLYKLKGPKSDMVSKFVNQNPIFYLL